MPIRQADINQYGAPVYFKREGQITVRSGPSSGRNLDAKKIPLDGRHYVCAGKIILKSGLELRANFEIRTHTFDFLDRETVRVHIKEEDAWYKIDEPELWTVLGKEMDEELPYTWLPDKPLEYHEDGPYPMEF
jgi:hypothetical protein